MNGRHRGRDFNLTVMLVAATAMICGCQPRPDMAPVEGKVLYNDQPLHFGIVMFQPTQGQIAQGIIQSDGTFSLSTFQPGDGAVPGTYNISVLCYEAHDPNGPGPKEDAGGGMWLGKSLIPLKYTRTRSSGLSADVSLDKPNDVVLELKGKGPR